MSSELRALLGGSGGPFSLEIARARLLINFRRPQGCFGRTFSLDLVRRGSFLGRGGRPGRRFRSGNGAFFDDFRYAAAFTTENDRSGFHTIPANVL